MANNPEAKITVKMFNDDFKKGAKELTKESQTISREFKLQSEQMKLTASETEKLQAKMEFLTKKHDVAKKSVQEHEKAYEQAKAMFGENSQAAEDMAKKLDNARIEEQKLANEVELTSRALQAQASEAEKSTSKLEAMSEKLGDIGSKAKEIGGKMTDVGKDMSMKVTAPITAAGGAMFKFAVDQEKAFAQVKTLLSGSAEDYDQYKKTIREYSSEMGVSFEDYAEAVYSSISAGQDQADAIEFTAKAVKLAGGGFTETSKAVDVMTTALNAYKMESSEAEKISDMLITTQNLGKTTVDDLSSSMGAVIPVAKAQNVEFEQLAAGYAVLTKNGIDTAQAGTYMKAMFGELGKAGSKVDKILRKETGKSFSELQADGKNTGDILAILQEQADKSGLKLSDMFGSVQAGSAALELASNGGAEFQEFLGEMQNSAGATQKAFDIMADTASDKMQIAWTRIKNVLGEIGDVMLPVVADFAEKFGSLVKKVSGMDPAVQKTIVVIGGLIAAIGPVLIILGTLVSSVGTLFTAFSTISGAIAVVTTGAAAATPAIGALAAVFTFITGPIGIAIAAIMAVIAVVVLLVKNWDTIKEKTTEIWKAIQTFLSTTLDSMSKKFEAIMQAIKVVIDNAWNAIERVWMAVLQKIAKALGLDFEKMRNSVQTIMDTIKQTIDTVWNYIRESFQNAISFVKALVTGDFEGMKNAIKNQMGLIKETIGFIWSDVKEIFSNSIDTIKTALSGGFEKAVDIVKGFGQKFYDAGANIVSMIADGIKSAVSKVTDAIGNVVGKVRDFLPFSPAKTGPLQDIDNLNFGGPIGDSIKRAMPKIQGLMGDMLQLPEVNAALISRGTALANSVANTTNTHNVTNHYHATIEGVETWEQIVQLFNRLPQATRSF